MSDLGVKVGQIWRNKAHGGDHVVVHVEGNSVTLYRRDIGVFGMQISTAFIDKYELVSTSEASKRGVSDV